VRSVGCSKEIINRGGKKFFRARLRKSSAPTKVLHAAMVRRRAHARLGECNCLSVVPRACATLDEFNDFLSDQVRTCKLPERLEILDELPFTPMGNIQRFLLQRRKRCVALKAKRSDPAGNP
jgi:non-ribosomal peptide synthetase component E (peptide arylation enzyme)